MAGERGFIMFVQVIEGRVNDAEAVRRQLDRWDSELKPGASGFLGSTGGITDDGRLIMFARFESEQAAQANADRPEQGEWFAEMAKCFDGEPTFTNSTDVDTFLAGGSDDAGFVQVMRSKGIDRGRVAEMDALFEPHAKTWRPDLIGGLRVWTGPGECTEVNYFTSEAEARANEQKPPPPEAAAGFAEFEEMTANTEFIDLHDPVIVSR
jgi:hypothetical protein